MNEKLVEHLRTRAALWTDNPESQIDRDAADEIVRLRAELNRRVHPGQGEGYALEEDRLREVVSTLRAEVTARDALIAEALAVLSSSSSVPLGADALWQQRQVMQEARNVLARTQQGATDRRGAAGDGPPTTDDPVPLGSDQDRLFNVLDQHQPDSDNPDYCTCGADGGPAHQAAALLGDATEFGVDPKAVAVVSADLIRAEALETAAEGLAGPSIPLAADWLRRRAAEYREAADHD